MFKFSYSLSGENFQTPVIKASTASETFTDGEGLVQTTGAMTKVAATAAPTHICGQAYVAPASDNKDLVVYPVLPHHVYETTFAADATSTVEGAKVTLHTDGAQVTATTSSGVATIVKKLGTGASGTAVLVRFV